MLTDGNSSSIALIEKHFGTLKDPRTQHNIEHLLIDIIVITICATICGANDWEAVAAYGNSKYEWLKTVLALPNGIPSHDTFNRLFARLKPEELQKCFISWMQAVHEVTRGELLNIDAMGCQTEIAKTIIEQGADYVLALKANQGNLYEDVTQLFANQIATKDNSVGNQFHSTIEKGHGRIEIRRYSVMGNTEYLLGAEKWEGLKSIGMVESERRINGQISDVERRYYILSIESDVKRFAEAVRNHWSIENQLHWVLDVSFQEDSNHSCHGHSAENLAVIRHIGVNLLSKEKTAKVGVENKRLKAGWDNQYLEKVLSSLNISKS